MAHCGSWLQTTVSRWPSLYSQEIQVETYAVAKANFLLKGEDNDADNLEGVGVLNHLRRRSWLLRLLGSLENQKKTTFLLPQGQIEAERSPLAQLYRQRQTRD